MKPPKIKQIINNGVVMALTENGALWMMTGANAWSQTPGPNNQAIQSIEFPRFGSLTCLSNGRLYVYNGATWGAPLPQIGSPGDAAVGPIIDFDFANGGWVTVVLQANGDQGNDIWTLSPGGWVKLA